MEPPHPPFPHCWLTYYFFIVKLHDFIPLVQENIPKIRSTIVASQQGTPGIKENLLNFFDTFATNPGIEI